MRRRRVRTYRRVWRVCRARVNGPIGEPAPQRVMAVYKLKRTPSLVQRPSERTELGELRVRMQMERNNNKRVIRNRVARRHQSVHGKSTDLYGVLETRVENPNSYGHEISSSPQGLQSIQRLHLVLLVNLQRNIRPLGVRTSRHLQGHVQLLGRLGLRQTGVNYQRPTRPVERVLLPKSLGIKRTGAHYQRLLRRLTVFVMVEMGPLP
jgi:hypothetical protein